jgi:hypothetical protein
MNAKSVNAAANPSSREIGFKALNSMQKIEFVKFVNSSRGVLWEVSGVMLRDTLVDGLTYLMNLILHNKYKYLTSFMGLDVSLTDLTDLTNPRLGANAAPDLTGPNPLGSGERRILGRMLNSPRPPEPRGGYHGCLQGVWCSSVRFRSVMSVSVTIEPTDALFSSTSGPALLSRPSDRSVSPNRLRQIKKLTVVLTAQRCFPSIKKGPRIRSATLQLVALHASWIGYA